MLNSNNTHEAVPIETILQETPTILRSKSSVYSIPIEKIAQIHHDCQIKFYNSESYISKIQQSLDYNTSITLYHYLDLNGHTYYVLDQQLWMAILNTLAEDQISDIKITLKIIEYSSEYDIQCRINEHYRNLDSLKDKHLNPRMSKSIIQRPTIDFDKFIKMLKSSEFYMGYYARLNYYPRSNYC